MNGPGARNLITDVDGLRVGHAAHEPARSGVTVLLCDGLWAAAVDVRGGSPGTRETEVLAPENLVGGAHAIVLAGGSVFGLAAADGVAAELAAAGVGLELRMPSPRVPIVPCAVLYDLANGGDKSWGRAPPYRELGVRAMAGAQLDFEMGLHGAGRGAMAGLVHGGLGSASLDLGSGLVVGALVAVNAVGSALMPDGRTFWAWPFELAGELGNQGPPRGKMHAGDPLPDDGRLAARLQAGVNTTLAVVACNADLSTAECKRVALMAHDGIARAVRPAHTPFDGDTVFALASGRQTLGGAAARGPIGRREIGGPRTLGIARIGAGAADCLARAIARAVRAANPPPGA